LFDFKHLNPIHLHAGRTKHAAILAAVRSHLRNAVRCAIKRAVLQAARRKIA
jgi:hypothetical protein